MYLQDYFGFLIALAVCMVFSAIASGKVNSAKADVSAMNQIVLDNAKLTAARNADIRAHSDRL